MNAFLVDLYVWLDDLFGESEGEDGQVVTEVEEVEKMDGKFI